MHYLLTATVRWQKGGGKDRVQVRPELVEITESGAPASRWQQSFDAAITDVFQVQADIATKVAQALGGALGAGEERKLSEKPTENLEAYDAFLKGEAASNGMASVDPLSLRKALGFYEQAVALDPNFVQGWARVSMANSALYYWGLPTSTLDERSRQAAEKAVSLAPRRPEGYRALGDYERLIRANFSAALRAVRQGSEPGDGERRHPRRHRACRGGPRPVGRGGRASEAGRASRSAIRHAGAAPGRGARHAPAVSGGSRGSRPGPGARPVEPFCNPRQGLDFPRRRRPEQRSRSSSRGVGSRQPHRACRVLRDLRRPGLGAG